MPLIDAGAGDGILAMIQVNFADKKRAFVKMRLKVFDWGGCF